MPAREERHLRRHWRRCPWPRAWTSDPMAMTRERMIRSHGGAWRTRGQVGSGLADATRSVAVRGRRASDGPRAIETHDQKFMRRPKRNCRSSARALVTAMKSPEDRSVPSGLKVMFDAFAPGLLKCGVFV